MRRRLGPSGLVLVPLLILPALLGGAHGEGAPAVPREHLAPLNLDYALPGLVDPAQPWGWRLRPMTGRGVTVEVEPPPGGEGEVRPRTLRLRRTEDGAPGRALYTLSGLFEPGQEVTATATVQRPAGSGATVRLGLTAYGAGGPLEESWSPAACGSPAGPANAASKDETAGATEGGGSGDDAGPTPGEACRMEVRAAVTAPEDTLYGQVVLEQTGIGEAAVSPIRLAVDGSAVGPGFLPGQHSPSDAEIAWVRRHAIPLASTRPTGSLDDLARLDPLIGDARFVMLGESTHGTHEFFTLKHRIVRWLAEERGFGIFALEDHVGAAARIDRYVQTGEGVPEEIVEPLFSVWERQEMLDLVRWMRAAVASGEAKISFWGFDLQNPLDAILGLTAFAEEHDPQLAAAIATELGAMRAAWEETWYPSREPAEYEAWARAARRILERVEASAATHRERAGAAAAERAAFDARLVWQSGQLYHAGDGSTRDRFMAENLSWIAEHASPGTRIAVWAHDGHVWRAEGAMGRELAARHPGEVVSLSLLTAVGEYGAYGPGRVVSPFPLFPAPAGSVEYLLHRTGLPLFALDLRPVRGAVDPGSRRLRAVSLRRIVGAAPDDFGFYPGELAAEFDAVLFVDRTTATRPIESADP